MGNHKTETATAEEEGCNHESAINVWEINKDRIAHMQEQILEPPRLLSKEAGKSSCCIFRVPSSLVEINGKSYHPRIVSIGPFHRGQPHLKMIEEHKWRYLGSLLDRLQTKHLGLEDLLKAVQPLEVRARDCYSEVIRLDTDEFIEMMVLDACFIIELFRRVGKLVKSQPDDPLFSMAWILPFFYRDLLRLENQIPYFVLECLFDLTKTNGEESGPSLSTIALEFFNNVILRPDEDIAKFNDLKGKHLLDLVRMSFIPSQQGELHERNKETPSHVIHCVSKLRRAGIKLNPGKEEESFLVVKFKRGVIEMPTITIDDFMSSFLTNCVAYEQCHRNCSKHFTTYATLLDCLVNTYKDVEYLVDRNIVENYFGTDAEVARFINNLGKDIAFDIDLCYLAGVFDEVNQYYKNSWHVQWASFKYTYFNTPWSFLSALAALILLLLTMAQTFYTIYATYRN